jgi:hypothetical protein
MEMNKMKENNNVQIGELKTYKVSRTVYEITFETTVLAENESDAASVAYDQLTTEVLDWGNSFEWDEEVEECV